MIRRQLAGLLLAMLAAAAAAQPPEGLAVGTTNATKPSLPPGTKLPPYVKVMLAFDGIDQDFYSQNYRLGTRLALIFAAGMEANKSNIVTVTDGDYEAAVTSAVLAAANHKKHARHTKETDKVSVKPNKTTAKAPLQQPQQQQPTPATAAQPPAAAPAPVAAPAPAPPAPAPTVAPAPIPVVIAQPAQLPQAPAPGSTYTSAHLSGVTKWIAGIVAPAVTPGLAPSARSESNRKLLGLLAMQKATLAPPEASNIQDVPATIEVTPDEPAQAAAPAPAPAPTATAAPTPAVAPAPAVAPIAAPAAALAGEADDAEPEPGHAPQDDAQIESDPAADGLKVPIETQSTPLQAIGEFAIITDRPEEIRRRILASASNFGGPFYALLHKFGVAQKPSLFLDGSPVLGPAAEALDPAGYAAAAVAAGLANDAYIPEEPADVLEDYIEPPETVEELLPDARGSIDAANSDFDVVNRRAKVVVTPPKGFVATSVGHKQDRADSASSRHFDGVPVWVVVPLAVLASLLGFVLIAAAVMAVMRLVRSCRALAAARRASLDDDINSFDEGSEGDSELVSGDELVKHHKGGYVPTTKALEKLNASMQPVKGKKCDSDRQWQQTAATTITSLQTGVTAAASFTTSHLTDGAANSDKPIVSGIKVPGRTRSTAHSNDGSAISAPAVLPGSSATVRATATTAAAAATLASQAKPLVKLNTIPAPPPHLLPGTSSTAVLQPPVGLVVKTRVDAGSQQKTAAAAAAAPAGPAAMDASAIAQAAAEAAARLAQAMQK